MRFRFALDSGAHSIFAIHVSGRMDNGKLRRGQAMMEVRDYAFYKSKEFQSYMAEYVDFVKHHGYIYDFYITMDATCNGEITQLMTEELFAAGLNPVPVFHYGSDPKYLKWMADHCERIALGVLGSIVSLKQFRAHGEMCFKMLGKDHKIHGLAAANFRVLSWHPWASVDSATPGTHARYGNVLVPKIYMERGRITSMDYFDVVTPMVSSDVRQNHKGHVGHYDNETSFYKALAAYLEPMGLTVEGVRTSAIDREVANQQFIRGLIAQIEERLGRRIEFYRSGKFAFAPTKLPEYMRRVAALGTEEYKYFATYYRMDGQRLFNHVLPGKPFITLQRFRKLRRHGMLPDPRPKLRPEFVLPLNEGGRKNGG